MNSNDNLDNLLPELRHIATTEFVCSDLMSLQKAGQFADLWIRIAEAADSCGRIYLMLKTKEASPLADWRFELTYSANGQRFYAMALTNAWGCATFSCVPLGTHCQLQLNTQSFDEMIAVLTGASEIITINFQEIERSEIRMAAANSLSGTEAKLKLKSKSGDELNVYIEEGEPLVTLELIADGVSIKNVLGRCVIAACDKSTAITLNFGVNFVASVPLTEIRPLLDAIQQGVAFTATFGE